MAMVAAVTSLIDASLRHHNNHGPETRQRAMDPGRIARMGQTDPPSRPESGERTRAEADPCGTGCRQPDVPHVYLQWTCHITRSNAHCPAQLTEHLEQLRLRGGAETKVPAQATLASGCPLRTPS